MSRKMLTSNRTKQHFYFLALCSGCLIVALHSRLSNAQVAQQYHPLTSHYLGTQTRGNEQVLLFKLPESISSHIAQEQPQLQQHQHHHQQENHQQSQQILVTQDGQQLRYVTSEEAQQLVGQSAQLPELNGQQEQTISLHIPISTLRGHSESNAIQEQLLQQQQDQQQQQQQQQHHNERQMHLQVAQEANRLAYEQQQQQQPNRNKQQQLAGGLTVSLIDYLTSALNAVAAKSSQQQQQQQWQSQVGEQFASNAPPEYLIERRPAPVDQISTEQQIQLLKEMLHTHQQRTLQQQQQPSRSPSLEDLVQLQKQQQNLNQQLAYAPSPLSLGSQAQPLAQLTMEAIDNNQNGSANSTSNSSLLNKLASSSPDLLLRLRALLRKASARQQQQQQGNYTTTNTQHQAQSQFVGGGVGKNNDLALVAALNGAVGGVESPSTSSLVTMASPVSSESLLVGNGGNGDETDVNGSQHPSRGSIREASGGSLNSNGDSNGYNQDQTLASLANKSLLNSFLSNQNLTSHEEIKIPLVVIAMPRIVSMRRNNLAAALAKQNNQSLAEYETTSTGSQQSVRPALDSLLAKVIESSQQLGHYNRSQVPSFNGTQQQSLALNLHNLTSAVQNLTSSQPTQQRQYQQVAPFLYLTGPSGNISERMSIQEQVNLLQQQQQQQQQNRRHLSHQPPPTTSMPHHTMAPYAQQFQLPLVAAPGPSASTILPSPQHNQYDHYQYTLTQPMNQSHSDSEQVASRLALAGGQLFKPLVDRILSARNNNTQNQQQQQQEHPVQAQNSPFGSIQIQVVDDQSANQQPEQQQQQQQQQYQLASEQEVRDFEQRYKQQQQQQQLQTSFVEQQQVEVSPRDDQQQQQQLQQQQVIYLNPKPQFEVQSYERANGSDSSSLAGANYYQQPAQVTSNNGHVLQADSLQAPKSQLISSTNPGHSLLTGVGNYPLVSRGLRPLMRLHRRVSSSPSSSFPLAPLFKRPVGSLIANEANDGKAKPRMVFMIV